MPTLPVDSSSITISEVWNDGVESAFAKIRQILREKVDAAEYMVAFDTEFAIPDVTGRPPNHAGGEPRTADGHYSQLRAYANGGSLVQVGLGLADEHYNLIGGKMFQFNIRFDAAWRHPDHSGVAVMRRAGVKLEEHATRGIPAEQFVELLAASGLLGNDELAWITFMGYVDFGYLIMLLRRLRGGEEGSLQASREEFLDEFRAAFPRSWDCKVFSKYGGCVGEPPVPGGLAGVAKELAVKRVGEAHQAASDALVALRCHRKMMRMRPDFGAKICNLLYGVCTFYAPSLN